MKVRPLHDRILLKRIEEKESVKGGIIIPDTAKEKPQEGLVVAVGNGKILENGTKLFVENYIAALGSQSNLHSIRQLIDAPQDGLPGRCPLNNLFCHLNLLE